MDRDSRIPEIADAVFIAEARDLRGLPPPGPPEIAIAGRSNVGKSTLLNRLAGRKGLARTSKTPGRTRGLVMFSLRFAPSAAAGLPEVRLVDLPGYGYAQVSRTEREGWQPLIEGYTRSRASLALFVVLVDARRGIADEERQLYTWLGTENVPAQIVFTKVDKLSASERGKLREEARRLFRGRGAGPLLCSAEKGEGVAELWAGMLQAARALRPAPGELAEETREQ